MFTDSQDHLGEVQPQKHQGVGQEKGLPQRVNFGKIALIRVVQDDYYGHFKGLRDSQDHLGEVQHQRHQGVGQEQGLPQRVNIWKSCINKGCSG